jgi:hypothetical protein
MSQLDAVVDVVGEEEGRGQVVFVSRFTCRGMSKGRKNKNTVERE